MRKYLSKKQAGDTIIEVLFAMVVVGASLALAYGIANRSIAIGQASRERSEALKLAEAQLEYLKAVSEDDIADYTQTMPPERYCLFESSTRILYDPVGSRCFGENRAATEQPLYNLELSYVDNGTDPAYFESIVTWIPPNSTIDQSGVVREDEVKIRYRR